MALQRDGDVAAVHARATMVRVSSINLTEAIAEIEAHFNSFFGLREYTLDIDAKWSRTEQLWTCDATAQTPLSPF